MLVISRKILKELILFNYSVLCPKYLKNKMEISFNVLYFYYLPNFSVTRLLQNVFFAVVLLIDHKFLLEWTQSGNASWSLFTNHALTDFGQFLCLLFFRIVHFKIPNSPLSYYLNKMVMIKLREVYLAPLFLKFV